MTFRPPGWWRASTAELCRGQPGIFFNSAYRPATMTDTPDSDKDSEIEGNLGNSRFRASGDAVEQLLRYIGPALVWPVIASAAAIVIIAVGFVLSWTVFRS